MGKGGRDKKGNSDVCSGLTLQTPCAYSPWAVSSQILGRKASVDGTSL
jgi:hypothetical protein